MKTKVIIVGLALLFSMNFTIVGAHTPTPEEVAKKAKETKVWCCHKPGECDKLHPKADCEKEGGKVVENCKKCK